MTYVDYIARPETMALLGFIAHVVKKIMRVRRDGHVVSPWKYVKLYPYQTFFALVGAVAGIGSLAATGMLNAVSAFAVGYMSNSVADMLGKKGIAVVGDPEKDDAPKDE